MSIADNVFSFVNRQIAMLDRDMPESKAMLAKLRRAAGKNPCETPEVWGVTMSDNVQGEVNGIPTKQGLAIHIALTLYALHKQGLTRSVSWSGVSFGSALAQLPSKGSIRFESVQQKFNKVALSKDILVMSNHARMLVRLLRGAEIGFDYAQFAKDLYNFQWPEGYSSVRLKWGSDFYTNKNDNGGNQK